MYVRVATSQKANKIDFQHINKIIVYMITYNATTLVALVDFFSLDDIWAEVCEIRIIAECFDNSHKGS